MKSHSKLLILNDLHPNIQPGAASIALELARRFSKNYHCQFWCGGRIQRENESELNDDEVKVFFKYFSWLKGNTKFHRYLRKPLAFIWLAKNLIISRPDVVWVHTIGAVFSRSVLVLFRFLRIPILATIHDYSWLTPARRKLYPSDLNHVFEIENDGTLTFANLGNESSLRLVNETFEFKLKKILLKRLFKFIAIPVYVSKQQQSIYERFGYPTSVTISNYVETCTCRTKLRSSTGEIHILFAGRLIGKGLDETIEIIRMIPNSHLHLAGATELESATSSRLSKDRFTYHGLLSNRELINLIHQMNFTSVLSQCFDVFPTIVLESLAHHTPVLLTNTCGNFPIVNFVASKFVLNTINKETVNTILRMESQVRHQLLEGKQYLIMPQRETVISSYDVLLKRALGV